MALTLKHQTPEAFMARLRAAYRDGDPVRVVKIARFLTGRLQQGDFTDQQVRAAFGVNASQWATLKGKMQGFVNAENTVKSAIGE